MNLVNWREGKNIKPPMKNSNSLSKTDSPINHLCRAVLLLIGCAGLCCGTGAQSSNEVNQEARSIFKELIEINTTDSVGNVTAASEAMAKRLRAAGFPDQDVIVAGPTERKKNMVARFRGTGQKKPILFIGHLDVVEARREDWTTDPFTFVEQDGYFYGRGTRGYERRRRAVSADFHPVETRRICARPRFDSGAHVG